jgi:hypothetical protein
VAGMGAAAGSAGTTARASSGIKTGYCGGVS